MNTSLEYRLMCMKATELQELWNPQVGDYIVSKASYCCSDSCNKESPCDACLEMSNIYVISGKYNFHESIGGTCWYYGGRSCGRNYSSFMNSTACFVMNKTGTASSKELDYNVSAISEFVWLPRQDQIQQILFEGSTCYGMTMYFAAWMGDNNYFMSDESPEELWLKYFMKKRYNKKWIIKGNIKFWGSESKAHDILPF